ncbi:serine/threonine-protein kinase [Streptomyces parvulus]|uniref:non-specific serine/threonine protein kinase n=1 Tax=Streptomyces parvulus TaxID=146923 RepID=A0A369UYG3_9ACTN|nr:serine/threonine-protein kinase [Streptomyces parvulus]RDD84630.1 serine/threonine protein kinase [Streptomyces parvulus]
MHHHDAASPGPGDAGLVAGRYRLLAVLGEGGMGTVWRARDEVLHREVAVKEVRAAPELPQERRTQLYARLEREAWAAARISARGVVTVFDVATFEGRPWIVMEFVRGHSLADVIADQGAMPPKEAARIGGEILAALGAAHRAGVLHRDVKPANVLLADEGRVVLTDFGIATVEGETALTLTGEVIGSPEYLAPERALGRAPGAASDLWSLGVLLYAAVQGRSPFRRTSVLSTLRAIVDDELPSPHRAGPLARVIEGLTHKDPELRMKADEAERALRLIAGGTIAAMEKGEEKAEAAKNEEGRATAGDSFTPSPTATVTAVTDPRTAGIFAPTRSDSAAAAEGRPEHVTTSDRTVTAAHVDTPASSPSSTAGTAGAGTPVAAAPDPASHADAYTATKKASRPQTAHAPTGDAFGPVTAPPGLGPEVAPTATSVRRRRTPYLIGALTGVLLLLGGGLVHSFVGEDENGKSSAQDGGTDGAPPVAVTVTGGATSYEGSCPAAETEAPWFTATFTATRSPVQFSYRWVSQNGSVVDREWRTVSFREGEPPTKQETVRLSAYAGEGTLRSAMAVEIQSPFDATSNTVPFSLICRPHEQ